MEVRVVCYAGYRADEEPRRFELNGVAREVVEILDRWLAPDHRYFKLRASDGGIYILRHDAGLDRWELTLYQNSERLRVPRNRARDGGIH